MNKIEMFLCEEQNMKEIEKLIGFISEDIVKYECNDLKLILYLNEQANKKAIESQLKNLIKRYVFVRNKECVIHRSIFKKDYYDISALTTIWNYGDGFVTLEGKALFLYKYFESRFREFIVREKNCVEKVYPALLPIKFYKKTGYLKNSPQYAMFCCPVCENLKKLEMLNDYADKENIEMLLSNPQYALSPSACFHTYMEHENKVMTGPAVITFTQNVFRNEGRFNYCEFGRLQDYHVREIVFMGDAEYVSKMREKMINLTIDLIDELQLNGMVSTAADPFVIPQMQKFKKIQLIENSKYELRLYYTENDYFSAASFNFHGTSFTNPFNIQVKNCDVTVTGCVGFGLERWVLAFLCQYGEDERKWPKKIKEKYEDEKY